MSNVTLISTTDSPEAVKAALGTSKEGGAGAEKPSEPEAKSSEQNKKADSEPAEKDEAEISDSKDESDDSSDPENDSDKSEDPEKDKPKKKSGFQRRIDKLNARAQASQQEAEYWKQQALKGAGETKKDPEAPAPDRSGKPDPEKFDTHAEYVEALTDWKIEQKDKDKSQKEQRSKLESEQKTQLQTHYEREKSFMEKTPDYSEVMEDAGFLKGSSLAVQEVIVSSDHGPALMYELAKNPEEFARICGLSPLAAARELGKIELKISSADSSEEKKQEVKKTTQAPPPVKPVGSKGGSVSKSPDEMNYQEFKKWREAQISRR